MSTKWKTQQPQIQQNTHEIYFWGAAKKTTYNILPFIVWNKDFRHDSSKGQRQTQCPMLSPTIFETNLSFYPSN